MKKFKHLYIIAILSILIFSLTGCGNSEKSNKVTFNLNYETEIFKAQVDRDLISTRIYEQSILLFEPVKKLENSYMSVLATENHSTDEECRQLLLDYKASLESKGYKTSLISDTSTKGMSFLTYTIVASNGDIITVYSKAISNENFTVKATLFQAYSKEEETNIALKNAFDSITLKSIDKNELNSETTEQLDYSLSEVTPQEINIPEKH